MRDAPRPFDIRPTVAVVVFLLALTAGLIVTNGRSSARSVVTEARLVADEITPPSSGAPRTVGEPGVPSAIASAIDDEDRVALEQEIVEASSTTRPSETADATVTPTATSSSIASPATTTTSPAVAGVGGGGAGETTSPTTRPQPATASPPTSSTTSAAPTSMAPTTTAPATTSTPAQSAVAGARWTVADVIRGTISAGDGSNPNEEAPMGRHDAPLFLPQTWNWAQGPSRNAAWGQLGTGSSRFAEWRCAVIPENGHTPPVPFRINVRSGAYYQFVDGDWQKAFDVDLTSTNNGGYLGQAGRVNQDPFSSGGHGRIEWRREADGSFSAPWNASALMMHFWAGKREAPASGQTAEFLTAEVRLQQPDGQTVDLSGVKVLFQCGVDYYNTTGGQGTKVPGPGIGTYQRATTSWKPTLWVTLPRDWPADTVTDFRRWLEANLPPGVTP